MTATGHLLRIVGVAIILIAVQFMSLPARAHGGHAHGPAAHAAHQHHHVSIASLATAAIAPAERAIPSSELRAVPQGLQDVAVNCGACVANCCGNGMGCGAALAAAPPASLPPVARSLGRDLEASIPGRSREPDGLRRPPRPLA